MTSAKAATSPTTQPATKPAKSALTREIPVTTRSIGRPSIVAIHSAPGDVYWRESGFPVARLTAAIRNAAIVNCEQAWAASASPIVTSVLDKLQRGGCCHDAMGAELAMGKTRRPATMTLHPRRAEKLTATTKTRLTQIILMS